MKTTLVSFVPRCEWEPMVPSHKPKEDKLHNLNIENDLNYMEKNCYFSY